MHWRLKRGHRANKEYLALTYPNVGYWAALKDGETAAVGDENAPVFVVEAGEISLPSGRLMCFEPFGYNEDWEGVSIAVPPGRYPVRVTYVDISDEPGEDHFREAYATLILDPQAQEVRRRIITPNAEGQPVAEEMDGEEFDGFPVDAATACFVDAKTMQAIAADEDWYDKVNDEDVPGNWFAAMDDPKHICDGVANVPVPAAGSDASIVLVHTGWGDGIFPVIGGYDGTDRLIRVHMDFLVVMPDEDDSDA
jgi:hypothetical protein